MLPADAARLNVMRRLIGGDVEDESQGVHIHIQLPDLAAALARFSTPDGEALKVRDGVSPRP